MELVNTVYQQQLDAVCYDIFRHRIRRRRRLEGALDETRVAVETTHDRHVDKLVTDAHRHAADQTRVSLCVHGRTFTYTYINIQLQCCG